MRYLCQSSSMVTHCILKLVVIITSLTDTIHMQNNVQYKLNNKQL